MHFPEGLENTPFKPRIVFWNIFFGDLKNGSHFLKKATFRKIGLQCKIILLFSANEEKNMYILHFFSICLDQIFVLNSSFCRLCQIVLYQCGHTTTWKGHTPSSSFSRDTDFLYILTQSLAQYRVFQMTRHSWLFQTENIIHGKQNGNKQLNWFKKNS